MWPGETSISLVLEAQGSCGAGLHSIIVQLAGCGSAWEVPGTLTHGGGGTGVPVPGNPS